MTLRRSLLALAGVLMTLCAHAAHEIRLRIRNASDQHFEHAWQGWPQRGTGVDLGPLAPGATSRWHGLPAVLPHYRKTRVQLPRRQVVGTLLEGALMPGSYTLVCTLEGGGLRVVAVREPVPGE